MAQIPDEVINRTYKATQFLRQYAQVVRVYLFGSYVRGNFDKDSDIDVAVFIRDLESWGLRRRTITIANVQREVGDDFELHLFPASVLAYPEPVSFAGEIIRTGVLIDEEPES